MRCGRRLRHHQVSRSCRCRFEVGQQEIDALAEDVVRLRADDRVENVAGVEEQQHRDAAGPILRRQPRAVVDVQMT